jgi:HprK-related kinase A
MKVSDLSRNDLARQIIHAGIYLRTGEFVSHIRSPLADVASSIHTLYADNLLESSDGFADFHVRVDRPLGLRRWYRPQVQFDFDGSTPFKPLPLDQAFAMLEWGLNWCISGHIHDRLVIHAAAIERNGFAAILPAPPGSGKSTLCAALINRGWRLLSDELTLVDLASGMVSGPARPVSLKNVSIDVIRNFAPDALIGRAAHDTAKGTVAHMKPPTESVARAREAAQPAWLVFPRYIANAPLGIEGHSRASAFTTLAQSSFNYGLLEHAGFETVGRLVEQCRCFDFSYGNLEEACAFFAGLE